MPRAAKQAHTFLRRVMIGAKDLAIKLPQLAIYHRPHPTPPAPGTSFQFACSITSWVALENGLRQFHRFQRVRVFVHREMVEQPRVLEINTEDSNTAKALVSPACEATIVREGALVDPQMRASNEHLPSVRVPRAGGRPGCPHHPSDRAASASK